jgi:hypothetical protein
VLLDGSVVALVVQVTIVEVINMSAMLNCGVSAVLAMLVGVNRMDLLSHIRSHSTYY